MLTPEVRGGWASGLNLRFGRDLGVSEIQFGVFHSAGNKFLAFRVINCACSITFEFVKTLHRKIPFIGIWVVRQSDSSLSECVY